MVLDSLPSSVFCMSCLALCEVYVIKSEPADSVNIQVFEQCLKNRRMDAKVI